MDRRLVKALSHPLRVRILNELEQRDTASPTELADEWGESLGVVSYHFRRLYVLGYIEIVRRTPRRGAIQHHYRVRDVPRSLAAADLPPPVRTAMLNAQLKLLMQDLAGAVSRGAFDSPLASLSHSRLLLDREGQHQLAGVMRTWGQRIRDIALESAARLESDASDPRPAVVALLHFEDADLPEDPVSIAAARRVRARVHSR